MVQEAEMVMDEFVLQIFENDETFHFPLQTQKDAKSFVKALYQKGVSYAKMCEEFDEYEHNFNSWRKGLGRSGIGGKVITRINRPLEEFLEDSEDEDGGEEDLEHLGDVIKNDTNDKLNQLEERIEQLTSSSCKSEGLKNGEVDIKSMDVKDKERTLEKSLGDAISKVQVEQKNEDHQDEDSDEWVHIDRADALTVETDNTGDNGPVEIDNSKKDNEEDEKVVTKGESDTKLNRHDKYTKEATSPPADQPTTPEESKQVDGQDTKLALQLHGGDIGESSTDTTTEATSPPWDKSMLKSTGIKDPRAKATENEDKSEDKNASSSPWDRSKLRAVKSNDDTPVPKLDLEPKEAMKSPPGSPAWSRSNLKSIKGDQHKLPGGKINLEGGDVGESSTDDKEALPWARSKLRHVSDKKAEPTRRGSGKNKEPAPWSKSMLKSSKPDSESETSSNDDSTQISPRRSNKKERDGTVFGIKLKQRSKTDNDNEQKEKGDKHERSKQSKEEKQENKITEKVDSLSSNSESSPGKEGNDTNKQSTEVNKTKETNHIEKAEKGEDHVSNNEPKSEESNEKSQPDTLTEIKEKDTNVQQMKEDTDKKEKTQENDLHKDSDTELLNDLEAQTTYLSINFNSDLEGLGEDEEIEQTDNNDLKELRDKVLALHSVHQNGPGFLYVLTDSPKYSKQQRFRIATSRFPYKRLKQAQHFNVDMRMVTKAKVSRQKEALEEVCSKLKPFKVEGQELWFKGPMDMMISKVNRVSAKFGVLE